MKPAYSAGFLHSKGCRLVALFISPRSERTHSNKEGAKCPIRFPVLGWLVVS